MNGLQFQLRLDIVKCLKTGVLKPNLRHDWNLTEFRMDKPLQKKRNVITIVDNLGMIFANRN